MIKLVEKKLTFELGPGLANGSSFGLIVLKADETIEHEMRRLLPSLDSVLYISRVPSGSEVTYETLAQMQGSIKESARLFPEAVSFE